MRMCFPMKLRTSFEAQNTSHPLCFCLPRLPTVGRSVCEPASPLLIAFVAPALDRQVSDCWCPPYRGRCLHWGGVVPAEDRADSAIASVRPTLAHIVTVPFQERTLRLRCA